MLSLQNHLKDQSETSIQESKAVPRLKAIAGVALIALSFVLLGLAVWGLAITMPYLFHYAFSCTTIQGEVLMLFCAIFAIGVQGMLSGAVFGMPLMMGASLLIDADKALDQEDLIKYEKERLAALKKESEEANL